MQTLRNAARSALMWGVSFTLLRDIMQFAAMLVLVRLLTAEDYGRVALAQTIVSLLSVVSVKTFVAQALQVRDPSKIDWDSHFTIALVLNGLMFAGTLAVAAGLSLSGQYAAAALPLAVLSVVFLIEIPANLRGAMLQSAHEWPRYQILIFCGAAAGIALSILIASLGGGHWALVAGAMTTGLPLAADFYLGCQARPRLVAGWRRNRGVLNFGISRVASAGLNGARQTTEQMTMVGAYDFAALGVFTRAIGLATLISGRFGSLVLSSLYPAITRAEAASEQFRRAAGVSLRGIAWVTIPASCFLGIAAEELVRLLYGPKWDAVASLLPLAAAQVGVMGLGAACYGLLLANQSVASCLAVDIVSGTTGIVLALVFIPRGIETYLLVLLVHGAAILTLILVLLWRSRGIAAGDVARALLPPALASLVAAAAAVLVNDLLFEGGVSAVDLAVKIVVFGLLLAGILRIAVPAALDEMLHLVPGGRHLRRMLRFA